MSVFVDERAPISGAPVTGSGVTYTLGESQRLRLETLSFVLATSAAAGSRFVLVNYFAKDGSVIFQTEDRNDVSANWTVAYTFGIGLEAFCGTSLNGATIRAELPDTLLEPGAQLFLASVSTTGAVVSGDSFDSVVLYGPAASSLPDTGASPLLQFLPLAEQTAA